MHTALLLHNIRSAYNVGSIFRTADAAGVSMIYLTGYTPRPLDHWGRIQKGIAKTALGAETNIPWKGANTPMSIIKQLNSNGWRIVGIEQDIRSVNYRAYVPGQPTLFIVGNEVRGISQALRAQCDTLIEIPMHGQKESLNVAVATGIVLFHSIQMNIRHP